MCWFARGVALRVRGGSGSAAPAGAPLVAEVGQRELRKTVTVLFCDLTESTAMGEVHDAERVRAVLSAYFERMRAIAERYGGRVEKFIGDAVVAVFGVPLLHEDDALRAVRAAVEIRTLGSRRSGVFPLRNGFRRS